MNLFFQLQYIFGLNLNEKVMKKAYQVLAIIFLCSHVYVVFVLAIPSNETKSLIISKEVFVVFVLAIPSNIQGDIKQCKECLLYLF